MAECGVWRIPQRMASVLDQRRRVSGGKVHVELQKASGRNFTLSAVHSHSSLGANLLERFKWQRFSHMHKELRRKFSVFLHEKLLVLKQGLEPISRWFFHRIRKKNVTNPLVIPERVVKTVRADPGHQSLQTCPLDVGFLEHDDEDDARVQLPGATSSRDYYGSP